jgi:purine-nucleoside phosphorylase
MIEPYDEAGRLAEAVKTAVESWDDLGWPRPAVAVVSGSGLAVDLGEAARGPVDLSYFLPFAVHPLAGHPHQVELLRPFDGRHVAYLRGRLHPYQGYSAEQTVFPVRLAAQLGARVLILTNASGGLRAGQQVGDLLAVRDHVNLTGLNPLRGQLPAEWGPRFPDLVGAYDPALAALAHRLAAGAGVPLGDGVYAGVLGPSYETPAEVRMLQTLGCDLAGMSTVLEVIAARQMGLLCLCLSLVSNPAAGLAAAPLSHDDVLAAADAGGARLARLLRALLESPELLPA